MLSLSVSTLTETAIRMQSLLSHGENRGKKGSFSLTRWCQHYSETIIKPASYL